MPHFFGRPYIDVRLSLNSFIPADLSDAIASRLVNYYTERLRSEPSLHDKIEFEIVYSCYTFDLNDRLKSLERIGFTTQELDEIINSIRRLTNRVIDPQKGLWRKDLLKLDILNSRREALLTSDLDSLERIHWLLEDAKHYGTLPFAGLARSGFMAVQILRSLVAVGVFSQSDYDSFFGGVSTVSSQLVHDRATLGMDTFMARYGHLRPGTYDILSQRYDEAFDLYFDWSQLPTEPKTIKQFFPSKPQMREIANLVAKHGLSVSPANLFEFIQKGIELRELAKFNFTRNLSDALALITEVGLQQGFSKEDLAYCDIKAFHELYNSAANTKEIISNSIQIGKKCYEETLKVSLPPLISSPEEVWAFEWPKSTPNYITQKQVVAPILNCIQRQKLAGSIICIPNADPGFDWLFSYPIAGLITAWGGSNSHMAIRAGEIGLPAVIGAGEVLYRRWSSAKRLHIDCAGQLVDIVE